MRRWVLIPLMILAPFAYSQDNGNGVFWRPDLFSGEVRLGGHYRELSMIAPYLADEQQSALFSAGILLNTKSHFWHPNFLSIDASLEYNPERGRESFLVVPDRSEGRTLSRLDLLATMFRQRTFTLSGFLNLSESEANRENLSSISTSFRNAGGMLGWANSVLPAELTYTTSRWDQREILTGRTYVLGQNAIRGRVSHTSGKWDNHHFEYLHQDNYREYPELAVARIVMDNINLSNNFLWGKADAVQYNSLVSVVDQQGFDDYNRIMASELLKVRIMKNLNLDAKYHFTNFSRALEDFTEHRPGVSISHQLYASLFTRLVSEYLTSKSTFYDESQLRNGLDLRYSKQVPGGRINIGTAIYDHRLRHESEPSDRSIAREELLLSDGKPVLLGNALIQTETIVLTDVTGTVIYQLGFDYLLFIRGDFIEVQRVPGGLIQDGATVYARYTVKQPAAYHFTMRRKHFNISLRTLANHFEVYFNYSEQSYDNLKVTDKVVLDRFYRRVWGARLDKGILTMGAEWDNHQSSVMPYDMYFLFLALQGNAGSKLHYALHSSFRDIRHNQESDRQQYGDLGLRLNLLLSPSSRLAFDIAYRKQDGRQIELGLLTSRLELQTTYRRLSLVCGIENYSRDYLGEEVDVRGLYLRIVRKFQ